MTTEPVGVPDPNPSLNSNPDPEADVRAARAELVAALDAIQDKFNVSKRIRIATEENPIGLAAVGVGVAAAIAGAVWLIVRAARSK
ncbi:hypothetical protein GCM10027568_26370 [Humibacter soli]